MTAWLASLVALALVMSITPGPNNLLFAASGSRIGYARSVPVIAGMLGGFALVIAASWLGVGALVGDSRWAQVVLGCVAAAYLAWVAAALWSGGPGHGTGSDAPPQPGAHSEPVGPTSWWAMAALQGLNPKTWLASVAFVSGSLGANSPGGRWLDAVGVATFLAVVSVSASVWTLFGASLGRRLAGTRLVVWNRSLSVLSLATAVWLVTAALR